MKNEEPEKENETDWETDLLPCGQRFPPRFSGFEEENEGKVTCSGNPKGSSEDEFKDL